MVWALAFPIASIEAGGGWLVRVLAIALVFGLIVFVHEAGHFLIARLAKMHVYEFSIGFGRPRLLWFRRGDTEFSFRLWPFLSYVRIAGMEPGDDHPQGFDKKPRWVRSLVLVSGCINNLALAVVIFIALGLVFGQAVATNVVADVQKDSVAAQVGLARGDRLVGVGRKARLSLDEIRATIMESPGQPIDLVVERGGATRTVTVTPKRVPTYEAKGIHIRPIVIGRIGIAFNSRTVRVGVGRAIVSGFADTYSLLQVQAAGLYSMIIGAIPVQGNVMGPVGIVDAMYTQAQQSWLNFLNLAAVLTVAVGFLNLLPIPPLDGSRLLILLVEGIVGRQLGKQREFVLHLVGMLVLLSFVLLLTFKDIQRLVAHHGGGG